jgi:hypothetical protein
MVDMHLDEAARRFLSGDISMDVQIALAEGSDENGRSYYLLLTAMREGAVLNRAPEILKEIIKKQAWKKWHWIGQDFTAPNFVSYLTAHPPKGVGVKLELVEKLIAGDTKAEAAFRDLTTGVKGQHHGMNHTMRRPSRIDRKAILARLRKERLDLFERVDAGELSANAAAIEAGWRKPPQTPLQKLQAAWAKATEEERAAFRATICNHP